MRNDKWESATMYNIKGQEKRKKEIRASFLTEVVH